MKKRWFLVGMIFFLVPWLLVGCGVAQEEYDAVVSQLGSAQEELQTVKSELGAAQAKNSELTSSLGKSRTEVEAMQAKLEAAKGDLEATQAENSELTSSLEKTQTELEAAQAENETFKSEVISTWSDLDKIVGLEWLIVGYWSAAAKGDEDLIEQLHAKMVTYVEPVGDARLTSLWQQALSAAEKGQETLFLESFAAMMDRNSKLLSDAVKAIRSKLAD
jgi:DNA repair exonuclease SbcCD ATPase subunit